ncbi:MAG: hypothetical protein BWY51_00344 [Parcubacteria group bacterium ADurb.Bin316]|nr:MAG: hypothetical protein BWY51_00344 [Parcubacteria group bacterium ADurb.Bin316]HOZ56501.1 hypothetical protein [bacterium]
MKKNEFICFYKKINFIKSFCASALILIISAFFVFIDNSQNALKFVQAGDGDNVRGYAWSSNIGWISFNSLDDLGSMVDYGVSVDPDSGNFSGYAWSSNIGWISFNRSDTNNPPLADPGNGSGPIAIVNLDNASSTFGQITGWAKILSLGDDGWIRFSYSEGAPHPFPIPFPFSEVDAGGLAYDAGIDMNTGDFFGWAWNGNDDGTGIGWISLSGEAPHPYGLHADINRAPNLPVLGSASLIAKCTNILGEQLTWSFSDPDAGDTQSAYYIQIKLLASGNWGDVLDSGWQNSNQNYFNFSQALGHNISYNADYEYRVNVKDNFGSESGWSSPTSFSTPDYRYPRAYFNWSPVNPSAGQEIVFSTADAVKSQYYSSDNTPKDCDDINCSYQWLFSYIDGGGTVHVVSGLTDNSASTTVIFPQKANVTAVLNVTDNNGFAPPPNQYTCSTSTVFGLKSKLPTWIETK